MRQNGILLSAKMFLKQKLACLTTVLQGKHSTLRENTSLLSANSIYL